jgi:hypothetical protein
MTFIDRIIQGVTISTLSISLCTLMHKSFEHHNCERKRQNNCIRYNLYNEYSYFLAQFSFYLLSTRLFRFKYKYTCRLHEEVDSIYSSD